MSDNKESTHSTDQGEAINGTKQSTHCADHDDAKAPSSTSLKRGKFASERKPVINEWEARLESEADKECIQITPCVAAQLNSAPRKEESGLLGRSTTEVQQDADINDNQLCNPEFVSGGQSNEEANTDVQMRPKRTQGNDRSRYSRAFSRISSINEIKIQPISLTERRLQLRRRSTGSFREALEVDESNDGDKAACIVAHSIETDHKKGKCPRDSMDSRLLRQDSDFEFNPNAEHYPLRRNSTGYTLVYPKLSSEKDDSFISRFFSRFKRQDSTDFSVICKERNRIMVQNPAQTGRKPFGCRLISCKSGDDRWFHFLKLDNTPKSLARQLRIRDDDEVLVINNDPIICVNQEQVLTKFIYSLREVKIQLVIRRMISDAGGGFEFIELTARIEADDTIPVIPREERVDVSAFKILQHHSRSEKRISFYNKEMPQYINVQNSSNLDLTTTESDSDVFIMAIYKLFTPGNKSCDYLCTLQHKQSKKYITAQGSSLQLTSGNQRAPVKKDLDKDVRLFVYQDKWPYSSLEYNVNRGRYLASTPSGLCLFKSDKPEQHKSYLYCKITDPPIEIH